MTNYPFRTALVTGASAGIGESFSELLAADGVHTVVVARRADRLEALAERLGNTEVLAADLNDPAGLSSVIDRITTDPVDLVINNAGFGTSGEFHTLGADRLELEVGLNVGALTQLSHAALATMVQQGRGYLLNVSSVAGFQPAPRLAVYAATKAYVTSLTESLHEEVKDAGVHVTCLCPGLTRTEFQSVSSTTSYESEFPNWAWHSPAEVAEAGLAAVARNKAIAVPGMVNKTFAVGSDLVPRGIKRRLASLVQRESPPDSER